MRVYNVFADRSNYYIIMEYLPGGSLEQWMQQQGTLSVEQAIRVATDVCAGLEYAHEKGVVHCDIKPGNVLFAADGTAKVADFGVAHVSEELMTRSWQSVPGFAAGTMLYMAPEQLDGVRDDPRVDIYALGAMLYQMLTGRPYLNFRLPTRNISDQVHNASQIKEGQPVPPSIHNRAIPGWLDAVILKALAKQSAGRYGSAAVLKAALAGRVVAEPPTVAAPTPKPTPVPGPKRGWPVHPAVVAGALAALAVVAGVILLAGYGGPAATLVPLAERATTPAVMLVPASLPPTYTPAPSTATPIGGGGRIAFTSTRDGNSEIYVMNADGSGQTNLTRNPASDGGLSWSPDGSRIAFRSDRDGNREIYVMNVDGSEQTNLTNNPADDFTPSWSPDGRRIAFRSDREGNDEIYVMHADGYGPTNLTSNAAQDYSPAWSPDGTRIAFMSDRDGNGEIYVMNADGSGQTNLTNNLALNWFPSWSPDGRRIAFASGSDRDLNFEIYVINADGSEQRKLTNNPALDMFYSWSPDGGRIAFQSDRDGNWEIYVMNADGSEVTRLTDNPDFDIDPSWSPR